VGKGKEEKGKKKKKKKKSANRLVFSTRFFRRSWLEMFLFCKEMALAATVTKFATNLGCS
jgi:hypothetical protein